MLLFKCPIPGPKGYGRIKFIFDIKNIRSSLYVTEDEIDDEGVKMFV